MKFLFAFTGLVLISAAIMFGGSPLIFFNAPSLLIVIGLTVCVPLANHSLSETTQAFGAACGTGPVDTEGGMRHVTVLQTFRMAATGSGILGTFIGLVQMLQSMDNPKDIGPAMAVALLTILYAVFLSELVLGPLINRIHSRMNATSEKAAKPAAPNSVLNISGVLCGLFGFAVCILSMMPNAS